MFDYQYGTSTKRYKEKISIMSPRLPTPVTPASRAMSFVFRFLSGHDVLSLTIVNKSYYSGSWDTTLWRELSKNISNAEKCEELYRTTDNKIEEYLNSNKKQNGENSSGLTLTGTIKWRLVYMQILYKYCCNCGTDSQKLRFLPVMQRALCFPCAKLPDFAMISLENAINEYGVAKEDIDSYQLDGLSVPHTNGSGKFMFVYYLSDILRIINVDKSEKISRKQVIRKNIEERRRTELVYYMKQEGISDDFINQCLELEGTLANSYMLGKSRMSSHKISIKMGKIFRLEERKAKKVMDTPKKNEDTPEKRRKIKEFSEEDKTLRKIQLIERLTLMGLDTDNLDFDDTSSLAYSFIQGKTKKDLGFVAGAVWREFKPIFTGISSKTTQRIKDL